MLHTTDAAQFVYRCDKDSLQLKADPGTSAE